MFEKEAIEYAKKNGSCFSKEYGIRYRTYMDCAESREKRIAELEQNIEVERKARIALVNKIAELEEQIKLMNEQEAKDIRSRFPC